MKSFYPFRPRRCSLDVDAGLECLLRGRRPLRLAGARGKRLRCIDGCAWITAPGMLADIFLRGGEEWQVDTDGLVLIEAVGRATVAIGDAVQPASASSVATPLTTSSRVARVMAT